MLDSQATTEELDRRFSSFRQGDSQSEDADAPSSPSGENGQDTETELSQEAQQVADMIYNTQLEHFELVYESIRNLPSEEQSALLQSARDCHHALLEREIKKADLLTIVEIDRLSDVFPDDDPRKPVLKGGISEFKEKLLGWGKRARRNGAIMLAATTVILPVAIFVHAWTAVLWLGFFAWFSGRVAKHIFTARRMQEQDEDTKLCARLFPWHKVFDPRRAFKLEYVLFTLCSVVLFINS